MPRLKDTDPLMMIDRRTHRAIIQALIYTKYLPVPAGEVALRRWVRIARAKAKAADFMLVHFGRTDFRLRADG